MKNVYLYFSIGNGQPREPALCQLYRHTFVPCMVNFIRQASQPTADWPRDAMFVSRNPVNCCTTVGTSCTTNWEQIEALKFEGYSRPTRDRLRATSNYALDGLRCDPQARPSIEFCWQRHRLATVKFSKSRAWGKVRGKYLYFRRHQNFLTTQYGIGGRKLPYQNPARLVQSFRYNTGFWWTDGRTHDDSIYRATAQRRAVKIEAVKVSIPDWFRGRDLVLWPQDQTFGLSLWGPEECGLNWHFGFGQSRSQNLSLILGAGFDLEGLVSFHTTEENYNIIYTQSRRRRRRGCSTLGASLPASQ